jgi:hypothetical protein
MLNWTGCYLAGSGAKSRIVSNQLAHRKWIKQIPEMIRLHRSRSHCPLQLLSNRTCKLKNVDNYHDRNDGSVHDGFRGVYHVTFRCCRRGHRLGNHHLWTLARIHPVGLGLSGTLHGYFRNVQCFCPFQPPMFRRQSPTFQDFQDCPLLQPFQVEKSPNVSLAPQNFVNVRGCQKCNRFGLHHGYRYSGHVRCCMDTGSTMPAFAIVVDSASTIGRATVTSAFPTVVGSNVSMHTVAGESCFR